MADELNLPPRLKTWLDEGCDLTLIPDLETYARVIVIGRHRVPEEERDRLARLLLAQPGAVAQR